MAWLITASVLILFLALAASVRVAAEKVERAIATAKLVSRRNSFWYVKDRKVFNGVEGISLVLVQHGSDTNREPVEIYFPPDHPDYALVGRAQKLHIVQFRYTEVLTRDLLETEASTYLYMMWR